MGHIGSSKNRKIQDHVMQTMEQKLAMLMRNEIARRLFKNLPSITSYNSRLVSANNNCYTKAYGVHNSHHRILVEILESGEVFINYYDALAELTKAPNRKLIGIIADPNIIEKVGQKMKEVGVGG